MPAKTPQSLRSLLTKDNAPTVAPLPNLHLPTIAEF